MAGDLLWKPFSQGGLNPGGLSVLLPTGGTYRGASVVDSSGKVISDLKRSNAGQEHGIKFYTSQPGSAFGQNVRLRVDTGGGAYKFFDIPDASKRYEGTYSGDSGLAEAADTTGMGSGIPGGFDPGQMGFGAFASYIASLFPKAKTIDPKSIKDVKNKDISYEGIDYTGSTYEGIDAADYDFTDPMEFAKTFGEFNRGEVAKNFDTAQEMALKSLDTELSGLEQFVPGASALKRNQTAADNTFNQYERTRQIQSTLPDAERQLREQGARAEAYASGRVPDSVADAGLELGLRSRAADNARAGGFGAQSSVSRKASDLMSAEQRIQLSQYGDQLLTNNIGTSANLLLAPTEYSNAGSQINVNPSMSGSQLAGNFLNTLNSQTNLTPGQALESTINQNQFTTNLAQRTGEFNASNTLQNNQFNASNQLNTDQFNATNTLNTGMFNETNRLNTGMFNTNKNLGIAEFNANTQNSFAMGLFNYNASYAGMLAGAKQTDINTQLALQQQQDYQQTFQDYLAKTQQTNQTGSISQGFAAAIPYVLQSIPDIISGFKDIFGGGAETQAGTVSGSTSGGTTGGSTSSGSSGGGSSGNSGANLSSPNITGPTYTSGESVGGAPNTISTPVGSVPEGYTPVASGSDGSVISAPDPGYMSAQTQGFTSAMALPAHTLQNDPNQGTTKALLRASGATMRMAGVSSQPGPGMQSMGSSMTGRPVYGSAALMRSNNTSEGSMVVGGLKGILDPTGVLSAKDSSGLDKIATVAGDAALIAQLGAYQQAGDSKGFANALLQRLEQPTINALTKDPQNKAGLSSAFTAFNLYQNWDKMSGAQKSLGIAGLGIQGFQFATGDNLGAKNIVAPVVKDGKVVTPGLNVGQALNLMQAGYNVYSMVKNWDQLNTIQKVAAGTGNVAQLASIAKSFNMLGAGTNGAAVANVTAQSLSQAGWSSAPHLGVGAMTGSTTATVPQGYSAVASAADGGVVIAPTSNAPSAVGATAGSTLSTVAGAAALAAGAYQVYQGWGQGGTKGAVNGALGGSAMAAGLYTLGATNPYVLAAVVATSIIADTVKVGKSEDQMGRDSVRANLQERKLADKDWNVTLADGSKFNIGVDGHGGKHGWTNSSQKAEGHQNRSDLNAWDVDYTNDLDYAANMGGSALTRLLFGGKNKQIDQMGAQLSNAAISSVGYNKEMTPENYSKVTQNLRSLYAQSGIKTKSDAYQLANQAFAEKRINETDLVTMQQGFNMVFDDSKTSYSTAQSLMNGRHQGIKVADEDGRNIPPGQPKTADNVPPVSVNPWRAPSVKSSPTPGMDPRSPMAWLTPKTPEKAKAIEKIIPYTNFLQSKDSIKSRNKSKFQSQVTA